MKKLRLKTSVKYTIIATLIIILGIISLYLYSKNIEECMNKGNSYIVCRGLYE